MECRLWKDLLEDHLLWGNLLWDSFLWDNLPCGTDSFWSSEEFS